mmetsp:Transcript_111138/g.237516  ORF Transcript_111138/g.237516 Transcript_111138/m.237516 type:complete len:89 (+) Transcript_111138:221-487(+)
MEVFGRPGIVRFKLKGRPPTEPGRCFQDGEPTGGWGEGEEAAVEGVALAPATSASQRASSSNLFCGDAFARPLPDIDALVIPFMWLAT